VGVWGVWVVGVFWGLVVFLGFCGNNLGVGGELFGGWGFFWGVLFWGAVGFGLIGFWVYWGVVLVFFFCWVGWGVGLGGGAKGVLFWVDSRVFDLFVGGGLFLFGRLALAKRRTEGKHGRRERFWSAEGLLGDQGHPRKNPKKGGSFKGWSDGLEDTLG